LVERIRQQGDRRIVLITLTESGTNLSKTLPDPIEAKLISELADLESGHVQMPGLAIKQILTLIDVKGIEAIPLGLNQEPSHIVDGEKHH